MFEYVATDSDDDRYEYGSSVYYEYRASENVDRQQYERPEDSDSEDFGEDEFTYDPFIHENLYCSVNECMKMIESYRIRHNLNWVALKDLIHMLHKIIGRDFLPKTKYSWQKMCLKGKIQRTYHYVCPSCGNYLGSKEKIVSSLKNSCEICGAVINTARKYNKDFFITLPLVSQLRPFLEQNYDKIRRTRGEDNSLTDLFDGDLYKSIERQFNNAEFITLTTNTDGAQVFKSTKNGALWPLQHFVNELSPTERFKRKNLLCTAFSFGSTPDMGCFLRPFIEEVNKINENGGIKIRLPDRQYKKILVIPLLFTLDSVAKCHVLNFKQFNGYFGCPRCYHPGERVNKTVRFCVQQHVRLRSNEEFLKDMKLAHTTQKCTNGLKGISALAGIKVIDIDLVSQVVIDKMHSVDLGVMKKLLNLWLDSSNHKAQ